jgi:hypothetical protein
MGMERFNPSRIPNTNTAHTICATPTAGPSGVIHLVPVVGLPTLPPPPASVRSCAEAGVSLILPNGEPLSSLIAIDENGCWIWQRALGQGYGHYYIGRRGYLAHRVVWALVNGPTDSALDHLCRVRACVNPDHLEPCHRAENCRRGRNAKINHEIAEQMRYMRESLGMTYEDIGAMFGVCGSTARKACIGQSWCEPRPDRGAETWFPLPVTEATP